MIGWLVMAALADPVDLNAATVDELAALPGMGTIKARALAEWRAENGRCTEVDDLLAAPGIGPATVRGFNGAATCGDGTPPPLEAAVHPPPPVRRSDRVDLNRDGLEGLQRLPGVTEARARDIIDDRERNGGFTRCEDAVRIDGIGPASIAAWGDRCTTP